MRYALGGSRRSLRGGGTYSPARSPHNGPDTSDNILCLCPNHHVLFDHGGVEIGEDLSLIGVEERLYVHPQHQINEEHLRYRREHSLD
jgi:putative restriction endonuclease